MAQVVSIAIGFVLTTLVGGWWASRLQERSWDRQNRLRLEEEERERAAEVCRELSALLDKRLYRMRRLYWAIVGHAEGRVDSALLEARRKDYDDVLYQWNDGLNTNLAVVGSHFGEAARTYLDGLYEHFRRVGNRLEQGLQAVRKGEDLSDFERLDSESEGWDPRSLNSSVYRLVYRMAHDPGRHDDRAVSLALAANWLAENGLPSGRMRFGGVRTMGNRRIDSPYVHAFAV